MSTGVGWIDHADRVCRCPKPCGKVIARLHGDEVRYFSDIFKPRQVHDAGVTTHSVFLDQDAHDDLPTLAELFDAGYAVRCRCGVGYRLEDVIDAFRYAIRKDRRSTTVQPRRGKVQSN